MNGGLLFSFGWQTKPRSGVFLIQGTKQQQTKCCRLTDRKASHRLRKLDVVSALFCKVRNPCGQMPDLPDFHRRKMFRDPDRVSVWRSRPSVQNDCGDHQCGSSHSHHPVSVSSVVRFHGSRCHLRREASVDFASGGRPRRRFGRLGLREAQLQYACSTFLV